MLSTIVWGLKDVLIPGLHTPDASGGGSAKAAGDLILERLVAEDLRGLYLAEMSEQQFCHRMLDRAGWPVDIEHLRQAIRKKFTRSVPGTEGVLKSLTWRYRNVLLADHAREWMVDICAAHSRLLELFDRSFFSFDLKRTKADKGTFRMVLGLLGDEPEQCLLIDAEPATVKAAVEAGIDTIVFRDAYQLAAELARRKI